MRTRDKVGMSVTASQASFGSLGMCDCAAVGGVVVLTRTAYLFGNH